MFKQKQKWLLLGILVVVTVWLALHRAEPTFASPIGDFFSNLWTNTTDAAVSKIGGFFLMLLTLLAELVRLIIMPIVQALLIFGIKSPDFLINNQVTNILWTLLLYAANGIYLIALLIASISIMLRINVGIYNIKKFLGGFIAAVALSNLSLLIVKALLAIGTKFTELIYTIGKFLVDKSFIPSTLLPASTDPSVMTDAILKNVTSLANQNTAAAQWKAAGYNLLDTLFGGLPGAFGLGAIEMAQTVKATIGFLILVVAMWVLLKLGILLFERMLRLFGAAVLAPVVFAGSLLPNFQKQASQWWESTIKWILVLPITMAIIIVSIFFFAQAGVTAPAQLSRLDLLIDPYAMVEAIAKPKTTSYIAPADHLATLNFPLTIAATTGTPPVINIPEGEAEKALYNGLFAVLALFVLWTAGMAAKSLQLGSTLTGMVETPQKAIQTGKNLWKEVLKPIGGARRTTGGALNLATNFIPENKLLNIGGQQVNVGKLKGLGTQIGALGLAPKKSFAAIQKAQDVATGTQAGKIAARVTGAEIPIGGGKTIAPLKGYRKAIIRGQLGDIWKTGHEFGQSSGGFSKDTDALFKETMSGDPIKFMEQAVASNDRIGNKRIDLKTRQDTWDLLRALNGKDGQNNDDAFHLMKKANKNLTREDFNKFKTQFDKMNEIRTTEGKAGLEAWDSEVSTRPGGLTTVGATTPVPSTEELDEDEEELAAISGTETPVTGRQRGTTGPGTSTATEFDASRLISSMGKLDRTLDELKDSLGGGLEVKNINSLLGSKEIPKDLAKALSETTKVLTPGADMADVRTRINGLVSGNVISKTTGDLVAQILEKMDRSKLKSTDANEIQSLLNRISQYRGDISKQQSLPISEPSKNAALFDLNEHFRIMGGNRNTNLQVVANQIQNWSQELADKDDNASTAVAAGVSKETLSNIYDLLENQLANRTPEASDRAAHINQLTIGDLKEVLGTNLRVINDELKPKA